MRQPHAKAELCAKGPCSVLVISAGQQVPPLDRALEKVLAGGRRVSLAADLTQDGQAILDRASLLAREALASQVVEERKRSRPHGPAVRARSLTADDSPTPARAIMRAWTSASSVPPRWRLPRSPPSARRSRPPTPMRMCACARSRSRRRVAVRDRSSATGSRFANATFGTCMFCGRGSPCATRSPGLSSSGGTGVRAAYRSAPTPRGDDPRFHSLPRSATTGSRSGSDRAVAGRNTASPRGRCACYRLDSAQPDRPRRGSFES